jgi:hypothetical protein
MLSTPAKSAGTASELSQLVAGGAAVALSPLDSRDAKAHTISSPAIFNQNQNHEQVEHQQPFSTSCSSLRLRTTPVGYGCRADVVGTAAAACAAAFFADLTLLQYRIIYNRNSRHQPP